MLTLEFLLEAIFGQAPEGQTLITDVVVDGAQARSGSVYFALPDATTEPHDHIDLAFQRGAIAAIIEGESTHCANTIDSVGAWHVMPLPSPICIRVPSVYDALHQTARAWMRRFPEVRVVGVTGSVGKSTTTDVITQVLSRRYRVLKSQSGLSSEVNVPLTVLHLTNSHQRLVLEMGMPAWGTLPLLATIAPPDVSVLTLIAPVYLERFGTLENVIAAEAEYLEAIPTEGTAILNIDDANIMALAAKAKARVLTYGLAPNADFRAARIEGLGLSGIRFWMHHEGQSRQMHLPMLGQHSVHTALRAAAAARAEGLSWEEIVQGLQSQRSQLRLIAVRGPKGSVILDDTYDATPSSTLAALNLLNDIMEGQRIAILGDMLELGSYQQTGHELVGIRAAEVCDLLIAVGERARIIAQEAIHSGMPPDHVRAVDTPEEAVKLVLNVVKSGDSILVKGSDTALMERIVTRLEESPRTGSAA